MDRAVPEAIHAAVGVITGHEGHFDEIELELQGYLLPGDDHPFTFDSLVKGFDSHLSAMRGIVEEAKVEFSEGPASQESGLGHAADT